MTSISLIEECKIKLIEERARTIKRLTQLHSELNSIEKIGDEADQSLINIAENQFLSNTSRLRKHLLEVDYALARIHTGQFGRCEETDEPIEAQRLQAIPWTRLSIEGAEIREAASKRFAQL